MGAVRPPKRVKLIVGMLSGDPDLFRRARQHLERVLGPIDLISELWPFECTDYYDGEMGPDLKRQFVTIAELVRPERLPEIKRQTNHLEAAIRGELALTEEHRPVNLDPGYVTLGKLVLATTKDYSHRVYIDQGVYAEVTLRFESGRWLPWPWTYPDYSAATYHGFLIRVRERLKEQLSDWGDGPKARPSGKGKPT